MKEIIIGIASLPDRINCLNDTIDSLLPQCDKIILGLNNYTEIPKFANHPKIDTYILDNSLGDAAKFYKIDEYHNHYYLSCDDDLIYPSDYVKYMVAKTEEYGKPVGLHGAILNQPITSMYKSRTVFHCLGDVVEDTIVDYIGTGVLCFDTAKLKVSIKDFKSSNMADIWFGDIMNSAKIKPIVLKHNKNYLTYNQTMVINKINTIFDDYVKTKNDIIQTEIVKKWSTLR